LGWHILKNRSYEESAFSIQERNDSELEFFQQSRFGTLSPVYIGISSLVDYLSKMLFLYVQQALLRLNKELNKALDDINKDLEAISRLPHNPTWVEGVDPKPNPAWVRVELL
jgi:hypothetical protein